jgi:peptide subunit release factor RF-3
VSLFSALQKGLDQLSEEGAAQVFRPIINHSQILGAVGILQFDVVAHRLKYEYGVDCQFEAINIATARWITGNDKDIEQLKAKAGNDAPLTDGNLALDDGTSVQISECPNGHGKIKSPMCCGDDMSCSDLINNNRIF